MRRLALLLGIPLVVLVPLAAQQGNLTSPVSQSVFKVDSYYVGRTPPRVEVEIVFQDGSDNDQRVIKVRIPSVACGSATAAAFNTAQMTVRNTPQAETGNDARKMNYRILGYLSDNGCGLPAHTLVP